MIYDGRKPYLCRSVAGVMTSQRCNIKRATNQGLRHIPPPRDHPNQPKPTSTISRILTPDRSTTAWPLASFIFRPLHTVLYKISHFSWLSSLDYIYWKCCYYLGYFGCTASQYGDLWKSCRFKLTILLHFRFVWIDDGCLR